MAMYPELTGAVRGRCAIKNPLHPAAYQTLLANHLGLTFAPGKPRRHSTRERLRRALRR